MAGLQGGGKTTTAAKLAKWLMETQKKSVYLASLDVYRPAAIEQLGILAQKIGAPVLADVEFLFRAVRAAGSRARFVGITGTNGKSTTTALIHHILKTAGVPTTMGGNIGLPILARSPREIAVAVIAEIIERRPSPFARPRTGAPAADAAT